jgi:outer membrane lipoprotein SlyB
MNQMTRRVFGVAGFALLLATSGSFAQQPPPVRVRGTVEAVDGAVLTIKSRDGKTTYKVKLADNAAVRGIVKAALSDIKDNSFIGVTGMPQSDGSQKAVEIHIFPEALRGTGEGFRPWDLMPNSTMTNATVAQMVKGVNGQEITLKYKDGEKKVVVTPETVIVTYVPGSKDELKAGAKVFTIANKKEGDTLEAASISVGRDGITPPM